MLLISFLLVTGSISESMYFMFCKAHCLFILVSLRHGFQVSLLRSVSEPTPPSWILNSAPNWLVKTSALLDLENNSIYCSPNKSPLCFSASDWLRPVWAPFTTDLEYFTVNKKLKDAISLLSFSKVTFGFLAFHLKKCWRQFNMINELSRGGKFRDEKWKQRSICLRTISLIVTP